MIEKATFERDGVSTNHFIESTVLWPDTNKRWLSARAHFGCVVKIRRRGVGPADQPTDRTTPPSTRNAAPLVAEACSEQA